MPQRIGYSRTDSPSQLLAQKFSLNFDYEMADRREINATGLEVDAIGVLGSADVIDSEDPPRVGWFLSGSDMLISFTNAIGIAQTQKTGCAIVSGVDGEDNPIYEVVEYSANAYDYDTEIGVLTISKRGALGTSVQPAMYSPSFSLVFDISNQAEVAFMYLSNSSGVSKRFWVNPQDYTADKTKSYPVTEHSPVIIRKSNANSFFIFADAGNVVNAIIVHRW